MRVTGTHHGGNRQNRVVTLHAGSDETLVSREPAINPKLYFLGPKPYTLGPKLPLQPQELKWLDSTRQFDYYKVLSAFLLRVLS